VDGPTLKLEGAPALPAAPFTLQRLVPGDPGTGSSRLAIKGKLAATKLTAQVWTDNALAVGAIIGVVGAATTLPARIVTVDSVDLGFGARPVRQGAGVEVVAPFATASEVAASFSAQGATVTLADLPSPPPIGAGPNLVAAIPLTAVGPGPSAGALSQGTVLVPEEEGKELDRRASLTEHELYHTLQSSRWGPLLLAAFPFLLVEEQIFGADKPKFSAYADGVVTITDSAVRLRIADAHGVSFKAGDHVQITRGGLPVDEVLGPAAEGGFTLSPRTTVGPGEVKVRASQEPSTGYRVLLRIMKTATAGGLTNLAFGTTYGSLFVLLGKLGYWAERSLFGDRSTHPAQVEAEGAALRLADQAGRDALRGASRLIVESGAARVVRAIASVADDGALRLDAPLHFEGTVQVVPYSKVAADETWDWHRYYPASVPDPAAPARIKLEAAEGDTLTLKAGDSVAVKSGLVTQHSRVTAAADGGVYELDDAPPAGEAAGFRLALIDAGDPLGASDYLVQNRLMSWMRVVIDPYGNLLYRAQPEPGTFWDIATRVGRYLMSSYAWSALLPGWILWDRGEDFALHPDYESFTEQGASEESGDLYAPLARLHAPPRVVGDIGRHRFWTEKDRSTASFVRTGRLDAPGVLLGSEANSATPDLRVVPFVPAEAGGAPDTLNRGAQMAAPAATSPTAPSAPGNAVADVFAQRDPADPRGGPAGAMAPLAFTPTDQAWLPASATLERTSGQYVAFCQPGRHRVTAADSVNKGKEARHAQEASVNQSVLFDFDVADVVVTAGGVVIPEGVTLQMVQTQKATVAVQAADGRFVVTVAWPGGGPVLRSERDTDIVAQVANTPAGTPEPVEVSRLYRPDAAGVYDSGGLAGRRVHAGRDIHVPVRSFAVQVTDVLPLRSSTEIVPDNAFGNALAGPLKAGDTVFLLVPAAICTDAVLASATLDDPAHTPVVLHPEITTIASLSDATKAFLGDGVAYQIHLLPAEVPAGPATLRFDVRTWLPTPGGICTAPGAQAATLHATIGLTP
jgi:hypothetical protein